MRRCLAVVIVLLLSVGGFSSARLILHPPNPAVPAADAVVVFYGGVGERLATARRLVEEGVTGTIVLSTGEGSYWPGRDLCGQRTPYEVICVDPIPQTTLGEGRAFADLARDRGWQHLAGVTSAVHARRAARVLDACWPGSSEVVPAARTPALGEVVWEWLGIGRLLLSANRC